MSRAAADDRRAADARREMRELAERGDAREAWRHMCLAMSLDASSATCESVAAAIANLDADAAGLAEQRVALLTNFTVEPLVPALVAHGAWSGLAIRPYVPGFDTWAQEIADPDSGLRHHKPDVVIVNLRLDMLSPQLADEFLSMSADDVASSVAGISERIQAALETLRGWSVARIAVHTFPRPINPTLGILDGRQPSGQSAAIAALNDRLSAVIGEIGNAFLVDTDRLRARVGEAAWHDARMWTLARLPHGAVAHQAIAQEYLRLLRAVAGRTRKVLVLDADETLWGGVLGDVGGDGIALGERYPGAAFVEFQRALLEWHRRGVVLCLNSKNDEAEVLRVLDEHPSMLLRSHHFAATRINWNDKAANMTELSDELGLALESFVFVDDSHVECDRMRQALPEVLTVHVDGEPASRVDVIRSLGVFDSLSFGREDQSRGEKYRIEAHRQKLRRDLPSLDAFYQSLEMRLTIEPISGQTLQRAADLTQRTNQFNLRPRRLTATELSAVLSEPGCEGFVFRLTDRFGDYGVIGMAMLVDAGSTATITQLLLSCRVLKRTVEDSVLAFLIDRVRATGARELNAWFTPTPRNRPARDFVESRGFEASTPAPDGSVLYRLPADKAVPFSPWVTLVTAIPGLVR